MTELQSLDYKNISTKNEKLRNAKREIISSTHSLLVDSFKQTGFDKLTVRFFPFVSIEFGKPGIYHEATIYFNSPFKFSYFKKEYDDGNLKLALFLNRPRVINKIAKKFRQKAEQNFKQTLKLENKVEQLNVLKKAALFDIPSFD